MYQANPSSTITEKGIIVDQILSSPTKGIYSGINQQLQIPDNAGVYIIPRIFYSNESKRKTNEPTEYCKILQIKSLITKQLKDTLYIIIEFDEQYYIAKTIDFPLYSCGSDPNEAVQSLKQEIEDLYNELEEDDNFSVEWLNYKRILKRIIF